nr:AMP-binding protein [Frigidibacter albus]
MGIHATRCYGSSEHPTVAWWPADASVALRARTDGQPVGGNEMRVIDDDGIPLGSGMAGELVTRGAERFLGCLDPALNAGIFTPDGWFRTGDLAVIDDTGAVTIVGRKKDIVIRGGENISPSEVEQVLFDHPAIAEVAVLGFPDPVMGERVAAFLVPRGADCPDVAALVDWFAARGASRFKTPEKVIRLDSLPRGPGARC